MTIRYHYANERKNGKYIVFKTNGKNWDREEHKALTIANRMKLTLSGGSFGGSSKPYDFKINYVVIDVPSNTKPAPKTNKEKFVDQIIEYEGGNMNKATQKKFFRKNKKILSKLQGHYGREIARRKI